MNDPARWCAVAELGRGAVEHLGAPHQQGDPVATRPEPHGTAAAESTGGVDHDDSIQPNRP